MKKFGLSEAFAKYGAKLKNVNWSVSAEAPDGSLVLSLWRHHFSKDTDGSLVCLDSFSRWIGPGNSEFRENVLAAFHGRRRIRLVIVETPQTAEVEAGVDASRLKKTFRVREDLIGEVISVNGEDYKIRFTRAPAPVE